MPKILLDGAVLTDRTQVMEQFRQVLALPEHCGNTLDALWDCLTGEPLDAGEPILVQIIHGSALDERFGRWAAGLRRLLTDAAGTLDNFAWEERYDSPTEEQKEGIGMIPTPAQAYELLKQYNAGEFHLKHGRTVGGVLRWYAQQLGYAEQADYWQTVGILHDIDFEQWPDEHCVKSQELLRAAGVDESIVRSTASHGWGMTGAGIQPEHEMEKVLFATDELTGLIGAAAAMRPSKSVSDLELKSLKKKYKDKKFAAGCSREVIAQGAELLGWTLDELLEKTILAMRSCEEPA